MQDLELAEHLPEKLRPLLRLAQNLWWTWNNDAAILFRDIDYARWEECDRNPLALLRAVPRVRLSQLSVTPSFLARVEHTVGLFEAYMRTPPGAAAKGSEARTWTAGEIPEATPARPVAYFCAEYGIHESLRLYSGGLGMLAGDHLKTASDLGVPLVAIGLLYRQGYFRQRINAQGWQEEFYSDADFTQLPMARVCGTNGKPIRLEVPLRGRHVGIQVWRLDVGRVPLFLLDTDLEENEPIDRWITAHLYGGDSSTRILQEVVLGIGGVRALRALGIEPHAYHLNEGHSAFLTLELVREAVVAGTPFEEACATVAAGCLFTTHTPVPAGNDVFDNALMQDVLGPYLSELGVEKERVLGLGRRHPADSFEPFGMTPLAIRLSRSTNGVSQRHGEVCARMWQPLWPDLPPERSPIIAVTNGAHHPTWVAPLMRSLYDQHMGSDWPLRIDEPDLWHRIDEISDEDLWGVRRQLRARLVEVARYRAAVQWSGTPGLEHLVETVPRLLDPDVLTFGFARRVAGYKRWNLFLHDLERSLALLDHATQPVQFILAGKAHPRDNEAKRILQQLMQWKGRPELHGRVVFLNDYDQYVARRLVQGADVWVNLPLPPLEASGTSGMKVIANGGLNCSILDGWWIEGSNGENGWNVGDPYEIGRDRPSHESRDTADAESLLDVVEREIRPLFYDRDASGIPRRWVARIRASIKSLAAPFSSSRMVKEYARLYYPR